MYTVTEKLDQGTTILATVNCWLTDTVHFQIINVTLNFCDIVHDNQAKGPHVPTTCPVQPGPVSFTYKDDFPEEFPSVSLMYSHAISMHVHA